MADGDDVHYFLGIIDGIKNAVLADADSPKVGCSLKLSTALRSRSTCQSLDLPEDARCVRLPKTFEFLSRGACKYNAILMHVIGVGYGL